MEAKLTKSDLETILQLFTIERRRGKNSLKTNKCEFKNVLRSILNFGTDEEYTEFFDKIDIMREGDVDWEKMASFLLNSFYDKDSREKLGQAPEWKDANILHNVHKTVIQSLVQFGSVQRFLTVSRDGFANVWNNKKIINNCRFTSNICQIRDIWVTAVEYMKNINKIAVSFTCKEIAIYEASLKQDFLCQFRIQKLPNIPTCFFYCHQPSSESDGILLFGDSIGNNWGLYFENPGLSLFERSTISNDNTKSKTDMCTTLAIGDILNNKHSTCSCFKYSAHDTNVKQIMFTSQIELVISCSSSWVKSLSVAWLDKEFIPHKRYNISRLNTVPIYQGLNGFDYNSSTNMIATAGINYRITLRSFYIESKPSNVFYGHVAPVLHVKFLLAKNQLLSIGKDRMLRIWDLYLLTCIQRVASVFPRSNEFLTCMIFEEETNRLIITSNSSVIFTEREKDIEDVVKSHSKPVVAIEFDFTTNQLVSVSVDGSASIWIITNGQKIKKFDSLHGNAEITALAIYEQTPGFLTAAADGLVKIWNYNGSCLNTLECCDSTHHEIKKILVLRRYICVFGWSNSYAMFSSVDFEGHHVKPIVTRDNPYHTDDIVYCEYLNQTAIVTASLEGLIIIWNIFSEQVIKVVRVLTEPVQSRPQSFSRSNVRGSRSSVSSSKKEDNDSISQIICLRKRTDSQMANLVVITTNLWIYFWNLNKEFLMGQFKAQENVESIICAVDNENKYLGVGDTDGIVTLWDIQEYCLDISENTDKPILMHMFNQQHESITGIQILKHFDTTVVICSSINCSVVLYNIKGHFIGIFGQQDYWNINFIPEDVKETLNLDIDPAIEEECEVQSRKISLISEREYDENYQVWNKTILGKKYQKHFQEKDSPCHNKHRIRFYNKNKACPYNTAFSALDLKELEHLPTVNKPKLSMNTIAEDFRTDQEISPLEPKNFITEKMLFHKLGALK